MEVLEPLLGGGPIADALRAWGCRYDVDSVGATAFELFYGSLLRRDVRPRVWCARHRAPPRRHGHLHRLPSELRPRAPRGVLTLARRSHPGRGVERRARARRRQEARTLGRRNRISLDNMFFGGKLPRFFGFDVGPIPIRGGRATPHQGQIYQSGGRQTSFTPSLRFVADMSAAELHTAICGGPSDRRFSKWYSSGVRDWLEGRLKTRRPPD